MKAERAHPPLLQDWLITWIFLRGERTLPSNLRDVYHCWICSGFMCAREMQREKKESIVSFSHLVLLLDQMSNRGHHRYWHEHACMCILYVVYQDVCVCMHASESTVLKGSEALKLCSIVHYCSPAVMLICDDISHQEAAWDSTLSPFQPTHW